MKEVIRINGAYFIMFENKEKGLIFCNQLIENCGEIIAVKDGEVSEKFESDEFEIDK